MPPLTTAAPRVVIAGAGPAGAAAASLLREAGAIVTLLERALPEQLPMARRGSVVVGREAWDVLRRAGGASLLDDARNVVSESEQLISLRRLDTTLGDEAVRRGATLLHGHAVEGVRELAGGGVSVAVRDARAGGAWSSTVRHIEADWFIDATGGKTALAKDPRFTRAVQRSELRLLPEQRGFVAVHAHADDARGVGWSAPDEGFVINDRAEGILTVYRPLSQVDPDAFHLPAALGASMLESAGVDASRRIGGLWTFGARQTLAPHAAQGRILLAGDSVGTVMPVTQAGTMLALTDAERAAGAVMRAHRAESAAAAKAVIDEYDTTTVAMHRAFLR